MAMEVHAPQSHCAKLVKPSSLEGLNDDLVIEILCRLPYEDAARCKCVSKNWFSLMRKPQFVGRFSSMNKLPWTFMYYAWRYKMGRVIEVTSKDTVFKSPCFSFEFLPFYNPQEGYSEIHIFKTYNDLVLFGKKKDELSEKYYICNPLTMQWVSLPPTLPSHRYVCVDFICEYDQKKHHQCRLKVVRVPKEQGTKEVKVEIFSTETNRWNEVSASVSIPDDFDSIYVSEAYISKENLIILGYMKDARDMYSTMDINMVIFDIFNGGATTRNHIFKIPKVCYLTYPSGGLHRMPQGRLRLAGVFRSESSPVIQIWDLIQENNYEWKLMQEVYLEEADSECEWISEDYLKRTFIILDGSDEEMEEEGFAGEPSVLQFDPQDMNILYLELGFGGRIGKYDMQRRCLNIADHIDLTFQFESAPLWALRLQLWPTLLPPQLASHF